MKFETGHDLAHPKMAFGIWKPQQVKNEIDPPCCSRIRGRRGTNVQLDPACSR
jgi:hypothetical protein